MRRSQQQIALEQQSHQQRGKVRYGQRRVHRNAQRARILGQGRRECGMCRGLNGRAGKPFAVNVRGLRNACNAYEKNAERRSDAQPERPRSSAKLALGSSLHVTSSMTRFPCKRTQVDAKLRVPSRYAAGLPPIISSVHASRRGQSQTNLPQLQHQPPQRSAHPDPY